VEEAIEISKIIDNSLEKKRIYLAKKTAKQDLRMFHEKVTNRKDHQKAIKDHIEIIDKELHLIQEVEDQIHRKNIIVPIKEINNDILKLLKSKKEENFNPNIKDKKVTVKVGEVMAGDNIARDKGFWRFSCITGE
jgi:phosphoenolpyruvate-protein kinase (PTS system EI component)